MWEISNSLQIINFLRSMILGVVLCLLYDFLRAFRKTHNYSVTIVFFQDVFYSAVIAFITFIFLLGVTNGEPRGFVFVAATIGFLICRYTLSRILLKCLVFVICHFQRFSHFFTHQFYLFFEKSEENIKKLRKKLKKRKKTLKKNDDILYTNEY